MRVTNGGLYRNMLTYLKNQMENIGNLNEQVASGKELINLSDDPLAVSETLQYKKTLSHIGQYKEDITFGTAWVNTTQSALENIESLARDAKVLAEQASTDTYIIENREQISFSIDSISEEMLQSMNTDLNGKYIFSGFKTDVKPFQTEIKATDSRYTISDFNHSFDIDLKIEAIDATHYQFSVDDGETWVNTSDGTGFTFNSENSVLGFTVSTTATPSQGDQVDISISNSYNGDYGNIELQSNKDSKVAININGEDAFTNSDNSNIFKIMGNLWSGLVTNNRDLISKQLPKFDTFEKHMLKEQSITGTTLNRFDKIKNEILSNSEQNATESLSDIESVDVTKAMTELIRNQTTYQATLRVTSMISNLNIMNYL